MNVFIVSIYCWKIMSTLSTLVLAIAVFRYSVFDIKGILRNFAIVLNLILSCRAPRSVSPCRPRDRWKICPCAGHGRAIRWGGVSSYLFRHVFPKISGPWGFPNGPVLWRFSFDLLSDVYGWTSIVFKMKSNFQRAILSPLWWENKGLVNVSC